MPGDRTHLGPAKTDPRPRHIRTHLCSISNPLNSHVLLEVPVQQSPKSWLALHRCNLTVLCFEPVLMSDTDHSILRGNIDGQKYSVSWILFKRRKKKLKSYRAESLSWMLQWKNHGPPPGFPGKFVHRLRARWLKGRLGLLEEEPCKSITSINNKHSLNLSPKWPRDTYQNNCVLEKGKYRVVSTLHCYQEIINAICYYFSG